MPVDSYLPVEPFKAWLLSVFPDVYGNDALKSMGLREQVRADIVSGRQQRVSLRIADTVLTRAGVALESIYPYEEYPLEPVDSVDYPDGLPGYCHEYLEGAPVNVVAKKYGVSRDTMYKWLDVYNIPRRRLGSGNKPKSSLFLNNLRAFKSYDALAMEANRLHDEGRSWQEVAWKLGYTSEHSCQQAARRARRRNGRSAAT